MQLRRAVPLSLLALLASAGCVSVGPHSGSAPARGAIPPVHAPDAPEAAGLPLTPIAPGTSGPLPALSLPLPLGELPDPATEPDLDRPPARAGRPPVERHAKPAPQPRRAHPPKPAPPRLPRHSAPLPRMDELCGAAEGAVPPSIVDLCVRQYGR
ncbi:MULTISPECIES: hypothetical protein [unclassified Streptomyces]|uniref:hypothetical protein n=1 Tax=unclassified Streptomyces TaxID=2593676 RepID=UPI001BEC9B1F|nr:MULTISPECIES: hypothetical protein [unclassified Streptomyces]MBT2407133.1 hypothetical protein [Streptomyces sp. ISL-21]MBT2457777.1 hypothetical protein [Streptomyces sp. ISL-86]MBT2612781.1 hypothetical protein [Streptomyces sp. ISL-87]